MKFVANYCDRALQPHDFLLSYSMGRELILSMTMSLDGFVAGPDGEFDWAFEAMSDEGRSWVADRIRESSLIAMGRLSYQAMADYWPTAENSLADPINETPKALFSINGSVAPPVMTKTMTALEDMPNSDTTTREKVARALENWLHPSVYGSDLVGTFERLKADSGGPIVAFGGATFARSLIAAGVIDVYRLSVHPVVLGRGIALFGELEAPMRLKLQDIKRFPSGVTVKTYRPG